MSATPNLTEIQKKRLSILEPALRDAVYTANYKNAKIIATDIQQLLRATGHETRLAQSKNWLFEAALNSGEILTAEKGFRGVISKTKPSTKVHLEATALLIVCLLRQRKVDEAEPYIEKVINSKNIKTPEKRRIFLINVTKRFEMEGYIFAIKDLEIESLSVDEVDRAAGDAVRNNKTEEELYSEIGAAIPSSVINYVYRIEQASRKQLTQVELKYLPAPTNTKKNNERGKSFFEALTMVIWKSICDPNSEIYKAWYTNGVSNFLTKKYYAFVVTSVLIDMGFAVKAIAVPVTKLLIKFGLEVYCEKYKPAEILDGKGR